MWSRHKLCCVVVASWKKNSCSWAKFSCVYSWIFEVLLFQSKHFQLSYTTCFRPRQQSITSVMLVFGARFSPIRTERHWCYKRIQVKRRPLCKHSPSLFWSGFYRTSIFLTFKGRQLKLVKIVATRDLINSVDTAAPSGVIAPQERTYSNTWEHGQSNIVAHIYTLNAATTEWCYGKADTCAFQLWIFAWTR